MSGRLAAARDLVVDLGVGSRPQAQEALPDPAPDGPAQGRDRDRGERAALHADVEHRAEPLAEPARRSASSMPKTVRMMISSVIAWVPGAQAERLVRRATRRSRCSAISRIRVAVALHPLAVEGGQHQLALAHVLGAVEQEHRVAPHQRLERGGVRLAGMEGVRVAGEHLLDQRRVEP